MILNENEIRIIKETYTELYQKSKKIKICESQRIDILNKLFDDIFSERFEKIKTEGAEITEEEKNQIAAELKEMIKKWNLELEMSPKFENKKKLWINLFKKN